MSFFLSAFWSLLELTTFHYFWKAFFLVRVCKKRYVLTYVAAWLFSVVYLNLGFHDFVEMCLGFATLFTLTCLTYHGDLFRKILFSILAFLYFAMVDTLFLYGTSAVLQISVSDLIWRKMTYTVIVSLGKLISVLLAWVVCRLRKHRGQELIEKRWILLTLLFPVVSLIVLAIVYISYRDEGDLSVGAVGLSVVLLIANIAILYLIQMLEKNTSEIKEQALLSQQMAIQTESIQALEKSYRAQRESIHEHRSQLQTICDLMEKGAYDSAQAYIKQLQGVQTTRVFAVNTHHPIVDAVLNHKYQLAREQGIFFDMQVNDLSKLTIRTDILVVLLSNLLDNAIEACTHLETNKEIQCTMLMEDALFLSVRNTSLPVEIVDNRIATTKKDKVNHGYGLQQIRHILDKEKAEYSLSFEDGWFQFVAEIPLPTK